MTEHLLSIFAFRSKDKTKFPAFIENIENNHLALEIDGEAFYCFDNMNALPMTRTTHIDAYIKREADMNIDNKTLTFALDKVLQMLDPNEEGKIKVGDAVAIVKELKKRAAMLTLPEHLYRIAALCFFKDAKDLEDFLTPDEIERRANILKKNMSVGELLGKPMKTILAQLNYSKEDFEGFLAIQALNSQFLADSQRRLFVS